MDKLTLKVVTPHGSKGPIHCDSIHFNIHDNKSGQGGGNYGIRTGQANSLFALKKGKLLAYHQHEIILQLNCENGFATVENDIVTVTVEGMEIIKE